MAEQLRLIAHDADDLTVVSSLMQDAAVRVGDVGYDHAKRTLALLVNRYRWEGKPRTRARAALRLGGVLKAQRRGWPPSDDAVLALLAIRQDGDVVTLDFAGGASLRLEVECIDATLEDLTGPWGTKSRPSHK